MEYFLSADRSLLLASDQIAEMVEVLEQQYDYIVFDTPPVNVVIDALSLSKVTDGFIIVVKENCSTQPEFQKTIEMLKRANVKILGAILNGAHEETKDNYRYRYDYQ